MYTGEEDFILSYHSFLSWYNHNICLKLKNISYRGDFEFFLCEDLGQTYLSVIINKSVKIFRL